MRFIILQNVESLKETKVRRGNGRRRHTSFCNFTIMITIRPTMLTNRRVRILIISYCITMLHDKIKCRDGKILYRLKYHITGKILWILSHVIIAKFLADYQVDEISHK